MEDKFSYPSTSLEGKPIMPVHMYIWSRWLDTGASSNLLNMPINVQKIKEAKLNICLAILTEQVW